MKLELLESLRRSRAQVLAALDGVSEYDRRRPLVASGTNLLGLVKHLAGEEHGYLGESLGRTPLLRPTWFRDDPYEEQDMWASPDESTDYITGVYRELSAHSDQVVLSLDLDSPAHVAHWEKHETTMGYLLFTMATETAQHAGHATALRHLVTQSAR
ncbi:DinB family protein [Kribbella antibiotica]|uniref:DinB family protein n=1 Tax=Kribbella antibiotica TaxID=190195 RepID=UPI001EDCCFB2|nr:DinB family protein [Kribbella antibiotica]